VKAKLRQHLADSDPQLLLNASTFKRLRGGIWSSAKALHTTGNPTSAFFRTPTLLILQHCIDIYLDYLDPHAEVNASTLGVWLGMVLGPQPNCKHWRCLHLQTFSCAAICPIPCCLCVNTNANTNATNSATNANMNGGKHECHQLMSMVKMKYQRGGCFSRHVEAPYSSTGTPGASSDR
jgi:hypothetical protein